MEHEAFEGTKAREVRSPHPCSQHDVDVESTDQPVLGGARENIVLLSNPKGNIADTRKLKTVVLLFTKAVACGWKLWNAKPVVTSYKFDLERRFTYRPISGHPLEFGQAPSNSSHSSLFWIFWLAADCDKLLFKSSQESRCLQEVHLVAGAIAQPQAVGVRPHMLGFRQAPLPLVLQHRGAFRAPD